VTNIIKWSRLTVLSITPNFIMQKKPAILKIVVKVC
jgi:hypothetical protein